MKLIEKIDEFLNEESDTMTFGKDQYTFKYNDKTKLYDVYNKSNKLVDTIKSTSMTGAMKIHYRKLDSKVSNPLVSSADETFYSKSIITILENIRKEYGEDKFSKLTNKNLFDILLSVLGDNNKRAFGGERKYLKYLSNFNEKQKDELDRISFDLTTKRSREILRSSIKSIKK